MVRGIVTRSSAGARRASQRWTRFIGATVLIAITGAGGFHFFSPAVHAEAPAAASQAIPHAPFRIFFTGDTRGYISPCGCTAGQFGGLARRATFLKEARRDGDLLLDLGNLNTGTRPHDRLRLNYVLEGLKRLRYDAVIPGEGELALGEDFERVATELARPGFICANLRVTGAAATLFAPYRIFELPGGLKVAVVGLTSPSQQLPSRYEVSEPGAALEKILPQLKGLVGGIIVAGCIEGQVALELATRFPTVTLIACARVPKGSQGLLHRGGAPVSLGGERGQYVSWVTLRRDLGADTGGQFWLGADVADDKDLAELVKAHDHAASLLGEQFARETVESFKREDRVGSVSCRECHAREHALWAASKHAHAMASLREKGQDTNPNCLTCHLQDLPLPLAEASDASVGCEACHGGGKEHASRAARREPGDVPLRTLGLHAKESCRRCHDEANSPAFEPGRYWGLIEHGRHGQEE